MTRQTQWIYLDAYRRKIFIKSQLKKRILQSFAKNKSLILSEKLTISLQKTLLPRQSSLNKTANRCIVSGRNKNTLKKFATSRFIFRRYANNGQLPQVSRYSG